MTLAFQPLNVELAFGVTFQGRENLNTFCPFHEDPERSQTRSCSVSCYGLFKCQVCGAKGTAATFFAKTQGLSISASEDVLTGKVTLSEACPQGKQPSSNTHRVGVHRWNSGPSPQPPLRATPNVKGFPRDIVKRTQDELRKPKNREYWEYLLGPRGLTERSIEKYEIGADEWRITIPIYDSFGELINIRRYLPTSKAKAMGVPKIVSHVRGVGTPALYPHSRWTSLLPGSHIVFCEGEWDEILLDQFNFPGLTHTGGVGVWDSYWYSLLVDFNVTFLFDVHDCGSPPVPPNFGQVRAQLIARELREHQRKAREKHLPAGLTRVVELPLPYSYDGGDVTNWFVDEHHTAMELQQVMDAVPFQ